MRKLTTLLSLTLALAWSWLPFDGAALPLSHFASKSKLSSGTWVKIAIPETGMYEITADELAQMGFSDPSRVQVFGRGGEMMSEDLTASLPDDLEQVPVLRRKDKICFYGIGPVNLSLSLNSSNAPRYSRTRNTYSLQSYYFLTEGQGTVLSPDSKAYGVVVNQENVSTSLNAYLHEQELVSVAFTGSELLGDDLMNSNTRIPFKLINPSDMHWGLTTRIAAKFVRKSETSRAAISGLFTCQMTTAGNRPVTAPYTDFGRRIAGCTAEYTYYQTNNSPDDYMVWFDTGTTPADNGYLQYSFTHVPNPDTTLLHLAKLDYFIITYNQINTLSGHKGSQCPMGLSRSTTSHVVEVEGSRSILVWDVTTPEQPVQLEARPWTGREGVQFAPGISLLPKQYVAFDPTKNLLKIAGHEIVENQNLHAQPVPDMLILTNHEFLSQAERLADMHRQMDGMTVLVADQEQVFNEFSGGTPDAMAVRLMCKMFYDRDPEKFKYLLVFGNISYDNRGLTTGKQNLVISYVSPVSYYEDGGYLNNDFYGYLEDHAGKRLTAEKLCIGIGHFPVANHVEAAQAVDKLMEYVYSADYGPWRNNYSLWAENSTLKKELLVKWTQTDSAYQLHESHAGGIGRIINEDCNTNMVPDMAFVRMYPQNIAEEFLDEKKRTSSEAKRHIREMFSEGQYFATYVGHSGATMFSATRLWTSDDVQNTTYSRLPIMTTASCDIARIDSDHRGIGELMFHKRRGGAIALYTTTRQVLANLNDDLNRAFAAGMFSYNATGKMPRLGDAYKASKNCYGNTANQNKFHWVLLGDPAMRINYPKPLFEITKINGTTITGSESVGAAPLQQLSIEARVMSENDPTRVDTQFNGEATVTIYDTVRVCIPYVRGTGSHVGDPYALNYPRERLVQVSGRVVKGIFSGTVVMPRFSRGTGDNGDRSRAIGGDMLVTVYAHKDGTDQMVSGQYDRLHMLAYDAAAAVKDEVCPVIEAMYLNDEREFAGNATVGSEATLYVRASDNMAFNTQQSAFGRNMRITLDGGKTSYNLAKNLAQVTEQGRKLELALPLSGLSAGRHTLEMTVADVCGNTASRSISFVVSGDNSITLAASDVAGSTSVSIDLIAHTLAQAPTVNLHITDMNGKLVRNVQVSTFPYTWNLTNTRGQRVAPGLYRIFGNFSNDESQGGSNLIDYVVLPAVKQ